MKRKPRPGLAYEDRVDLKVQNIANRFTACMRFYMNQSNKLGIGDVTVDYLAGILDTSVMLAAIEMKGCGLFAECFESEDDTNEFVRFLEIENELTTDSRLIANRLMAFIKHKNLLQDEDTP